MNETQHLPLGGVRELMSATLKVSLPTEFTESLLALSEKGVGS